MKNLLLVLVLVAIVIAGVWAAANLGFDQTRVKTDTVYGTVREVVVKSPSGDIDLVPARGLIELRETQHWVLSKPKLEQTRKNGVLTLKSDCSAEAIVLKCYSDLRMAVPAGVRVTVEAGSGDVDLRGTDVRRAHVESDSGDIELDLAGSQQLVWARTDSGEVDVVAASTRAVDARSGSGNVSVAVGAKPRRVVARSDAGDVEVAVPRGAYRIRANKDSGDARIRGLRRNGRAASSIVVRTASGDIELRAR